MASLIRLTTALLSGALTNPRQLFAYKHVDDAAPAENGLHDDPTGAVVGHVADPRGSFAKRMRLQRRQCSFSVFRGYHADDLTFVGKIERIQTQNFAEAFYLAAKRRAVLVD